MRRDELERRLAQLLAVERDRHVVELGRLEQAVDVVGVAEDRRADLGVVAADALEDAGAVVQAVREHVDLRVLPGDELPVHPDEVRLLHVGSLKLGEHCVGGLGGARVATEVARSAARRPARGPRPILRLPPPIRNRGRGAASWRPTGTSPAGSRSPGRRCRAPSRGRARTGPGPAVADRRAGQQAERAGEHAGLVAEDVAEHVLGEDHVEMARRGDELHRGVSTSACSSSMCGNSSECTRRTTSRHSRLVSRTLALSTLQTLERAERNATRAMRSISATV